MPKKLQGVLTIAHTPFTDTDEIDAPALKRAVGWAFGLGADGIGTGMVSETFRLTHDAPDSRASLALEEFRDRDVARDHEVLDQIAREVLVDDPEIDDAPILGDGRRFDRLELQRAVAHPLRLQALRCFVLKTQLVGDHRIVRHLGRR